MADIKSFFHQWCVKKGLEPKYECRPTGPQHRLRFVCELRVPGHDFVGAGDSRTKKEATFNAARDFVEYLVRTGVLLETDVPNEKDITDGDTQNVEIKSEPDQLGSTGDSSTVDAPSLRKKRKSGAPVQGGHCSSCDGKPLNTASRNEAAIYGELVASRLQKMNDECRELAMKRINGILFDLEGTVSRVQTSDNGGIQPDAPGVVRRDDVETENVMPN